MKKRSGSYLIGTLLWAMAGIAPEAAEVDIKGTAEDKSGGVLVGATVTVMTPQRAVIKTTTTNSKGAFEVPDLPDGQYVIVVRYPSFADRTTTVTVSGTTAVTVKVVLDIAPPHQETTTTASPGVIGDRSQLSQPINLLSADDIALNAKTVVAQAIEGEVGVNLQRTSPGMAGIFVRGLTGNKVNIFVDGVRYSNGAQRGGVNTFLDMIDPSTLERLEVLRGPSSAQYGSDALGGSVQFLTHTPSFSAPGKSRMSFAAMVGAESAHPGGVGSFTANISGDRFAVIATGATRSTGDYRPGGGVDSHAAVTRFLGISSDQLYPKRMPGTGFKQSAAHVRATAALSNSTLFTASYLATRQDKANRWDQTLGGDGNLISELNDLTMDSFLARVEQLNVGPFGHVSATYSLNSQREERRNQGGNGSNTATISSEPERTTVHGFQFLAGLRPSSRASVSLGGDLYFEELTSVATNTNPVSLVVTPRRPRVPDHATFRQSGVFAQMAFDVKPDRLVVDAAVRVGMNAYAAHASDAPIVSGLPLWPDDSLSTTSTTFRVGAVLRATSALSFVGSASTGFRAPHMTDLGTLGLTGSGFEVAAPDVAGLGGFVGSSAAASAVSTGRAVAQVGPERSRNVDAAVRFRNTRVRMSFGGFVNNIKDNIQKQALILPQGAVGTLLGGQAITQQNASGTVLVALSTSPVLVRANFDNARIWGIEWTGDFDVRPSLTIGSTFTFMRAEDTTTHLSPNIEGGTPAPSGMIWARIAPTGAKWWLQPYAIIAGQQTHLSSLDLTDRRTGAERTRNSIQAFFRNGARNNGWVDSGPDGIPNNADDRLILTGETLAQVQDRVLGVGVNSSSLWTAVPSYNLFGVRFGIRVGAHTILIDAENLGDTSYRGISWGMDGPGRGVSARYLLRF